MVCSRWPMSLSISRCIFSGRLCMRPLLVGGDCQHTMNFLRQLFHPERFGDVRQVIAFEKLPCLCGDDVAGNEQEAFTQGITGALQRLVEMLPIETGHLHVADDQVEGLWGIPGPLSTTSSSTLRSPILLVLSGMVPPWPGCSMACWALPTRFINTCCKCPGSPWMK